MPDGLTNRPKVSVCVVTYNQEKYVRQCLKSIIDQKVDFQFEMIVADDGSKDGTRDIIREFAASYPRIVKPHFHAKNLGAYANCRFTHGQATGEYIAHLDGDDYALPGKLEAQVAKLDSDPSCSMVWHRMRVLDMATGTEQDDRIDPSWPERRAFTRADLLALMTIGLHSSMMYRASHRDFPVPSFDTIDYLMAAERIGDGRAYFVGNRPLGVYRAGIGIASAGGHTKRVMAESFEYLSRRYPQYRARINTAALTLLLAELKNRGACRSRMLRSWLATFHAGAPFLLMRYWKDIQRLRLPTSRRRAASAAAAAI